MTRIFKGLLFAATACFLVSPCNAQGDSGGAPGNPGLAGQGQTRNPLDERVQRQHWRIKHALKTGLITDDQAKQLTSGVDTIAAQIQQLRQSGGGTLKPEDLKQVENSLNQSSDQIRTVAESGDASVQSGKVLGPTWSKGKDGAQNPKNLLNQMKQENRRELRQEKQANEQKLEEQQLKYEREMVENLGEQKQDILKQKDQLKDVRKESGAD